MEHKQFVGSMAFNRFIQASPSPAATAPPSEAHAAAASTAHPVDVNAGADSRKPPSSTITNDSNSADKDGGEISAVSASPGDEERRKTTAGNAFSEGGGENEANDDDDDDMYVVEDNSYIPGGGGVFEEAKEVALNVLRRDSIVGNIAMAQSFVLDAEGHRRHGVGEMERSGTTVTATTEVTVAVSDVMVFGGRLVFRHI